MHLDGDAVTHQELVDARAEGGHRARVLVPHDELARGLAHELAMEDLHIGAADGGDVDLEENLAGRGLGHRPGFDAHVIGFVEHHRLHEPLLDGALTAGHGTARPQRRKAVAMNCC